MLEHMVVTTYIMVLTIPIVAIVTHHRRKVLELQMRLRGQADERVMDEVRALRRALDGLRDTSTRYDLSFDQALQLLEQRVAAAERRAAVLSGEDAETVQARQGGAG